MENCSTITNEKVEIGRGKGSIILFLILLVAVVLPANMAFAKSGRLIGSVVDSETGEPLIGATIMLKGTSIGAQSDVDGNYIIKVIPAGSYEIMVSSIGYSQLEIQEFAIGDDQSLTLDFALQPSTQQLDKIVVTAKAMKNTEVNLLRERQKSSSISDAISSEAFSRAGSGDAAEALTKVTGASVVGGQFVVIRGLGGRYGNTSLNGISIPTPDPDQQSVPVDLFPTSLLDNVVVEKTFTPDKPGNFSGGSVDLRTKDVPEGLILSFASSASFNANTTFNDNFLSANTSSTDWLGYDNGSRDVPGIMTGDVYIPSILSAQQNLDSALYLEELTKAFTSSMNAVSHRTKAPFNQSYSFSFGNNYSLADHPLNLLASLSYKHSYSFYDDGKVGRWQLTGEDATNLSKAYLVDDSKGTEEVLWGSLLNLNYSPHQNHKISSQIIYNQQGKQESRYLHGPLEADGLTGDRWFEHRVISYQSQSVGSFQLDGEHYFKPVRLDWTASYTDSKREEPDTRHFSNDVYQYIESIDPETNDTTFAYSFSVRANIFELPLRFWRDVEETNREGKLNLKIPFGKINGQDFNFTTGASYIKKKRDVSEVQYNFKNPGSAGYFDGMEDSPWIGDPDDYFADENIGLVDSVLSGYPPRWTYVIGTVVQRSVDAKNNFTGEEEIFGYYGMIDFKLLPRLNFVGGARFESTRISIFNKKGETDTGDYGRLKKDDVLPSVSLNYNLTDDMNMRLVYGRTLARPTIREISPMYTQEFDHGFIFTGNPDLNRTLIDNYDLRWEWFNEPGRILAISGFYKHFKDPIERVIINGNFVVTYKNVEKAEVVGAEFEVRQSLAHLTNRLRNFSLEGNFTLTHSTINVGDYELSLRRAYDSLASDTRPLQGQSPYLVNVSLNFNSIKSGTTATLLMNIFGDRLSEVSEGGTPDVYERSRTELDCTLSQRVFGGLKLKLAGKNLLDSRISKTIEYKGVDYIFQEYTRGRTISAGLSYSI